MEFVCLHLKTSARLVVIDYIDRVFRRMWAVLVNTIFWISLRHGCPGILFVNSSVPLFITPSAPITTGMMVTFIPHIFWISMSKSLYFESFFILLLLLLLLLLLFYFLWYLYIHVIQPNLTQRLQAGDGYDVYSTQQWNFPYIIVFLREICFL